MSKVNKEMLVSDILYNDTNIEQVEAIQKAYEIEQELGYLFDDNIPLISDCLSYEDLKMLKAMGI